SHRRWECHTKDISAEHCPATSSISGLKDTLATHGKGTVIEIACAGINGIMVVWIDRNTVDRCSGNKWIIGYHVPGGRIATTICCFPSTAADGPKVSHNTTVHGSGWIDRHGVNTPFCRRVIKTA